VPSWRVGKTEPTIGSETIAASASGVLDRMQGVRFSLRIWTGPSRGR
jgi:hypothetical protein